MNGLRFPGVLGGIVVGVFLSGTAGAHEPGTWNDFTTWILVGKGGCTSCHVAGSPNDSGNLEPAPDDEGWYNALVNVVPTFGSTGKLRVHAGRPWNSLLVDKLSGDVKTAEGEPMPYGSHGFAFTCPAAVEMLKEWILAGAEPTGFHSPNYDHRFVCDVPQPAFVPPAAPASGFQALGSSFVVARPDREREETTELQVNVGGAGDAFVNRIEIAASAGTEYVTVSRQGDEAPLAVARGESLDLSLPEGVGVRIAPGETLVIRQVIRNDYWVALANGTYANQTSGTVAVNLHTSDAVTSEAQPFLDDTGTQMLFVPPRRMATSGGVWSAAGEAPSGAKVGIWTDRRIYEANLIDGTGQTASGEELTEGYLDVGGSGVPMGPLTYGCTHSNGTTTNVLPSAWAATQGLDFAMDALGVSQPPRWGCAETTGVSPGTPLLVGGPSENCHRQSVAVKDCQTTCGLANLVGGEGVDDGRCRLIGLYW